MAEFAKEVFPINLEDEMRQSYLDYAMSVIVGRALPDVRDGLKPVHRRVLYAMSELSLEYNKPYKKSARVVGDVIGKYHPHGDTAVYDTMVRMAQDFSMRYMLVDGQGNFGSVDGDPPAAMRYTEVRMQKIAQQLLLDLDKNTVDFAENYDGSEREPTVLPARLPTLLVNGSSGIAVGMATNIPPHNLNEVIDGTLALIDNPSLEINDLLNYIHGPDFPTAALINGVGGIRAAYNTGRGSICMRARAHIELDEGKSRSSIVVTELPYQVNKAKLLEKIAELVKTKKLEGIVAMRDESDKEGMRMVIELRRGEVGEVVLNNLYAQTQLQSSFGINMVALDKGQPKLMNLKDILQAFISYRREVVTRRTLFELARAKERTHILEGLAVALSNIDAIIALIKAAANPTVAKEQLLARVWNSGVVAQMLERAGATATRPDDLGAEFGLHDDGYHLSPAQAQAILDLRLHRLTGLEQEKIVSEYGELLAQIAALLAILQNPDQLTQVVKDELIAVKTEFGDPRRTEILQDYNDLSVEDLITEEDVVVTLSHAGYAKAQPLSDYSAQRRGGRGKTATKMKDEDSIDQLFVASTHDTMLCFSSLGKVYWQKVYELPIGSRNARGKPIVNLLPLEADERISAILPVRDFDSGQFVFMATANGTVKRCALESFSRQRSSGIIALDIRDGDRLVDVALTDGNSDVMLFSNAGKSVRFAESDVRVMGRTAAGVRGIRLKEGDSMVALIIVGDGDILSVTENGYGKRTPVDEHPHKVRGGQGVVAIKTSERNGKVVGAAQVGADDEIMLISNNGVLVRISVAEIALMGRNTLGVRLIKLAQGDSLVELECLANLGNDDETDSDSEE